MQVASQGAESTAEKFRGSLIVRICALLESIISRFTLVPSWRLLPAGERSKMRTTQLGST
jgi:hypothetical protein